MTGWIHVSSPVPSGEPAIGLTIRVVLSRYCTDEVCRLSTLRAANYVISVVAVSYTHLTLPTIYSV